MNLKQIIFIPLLVTCFFSSYAQYYYIPDNSSNLLMIEKKGDLKISSTFPIGAPIHAQIAYSPLSKLALTLGYHKHEIVVDDIEISTRGKGFSASIGTYISSNGLKQNQLDSLKKGQTNFLIDFYLGYSNSEIRNDYFSATSTIFNYNKIFLQTGFHINTRLLGISFVLKGSNLDYQKGIINGNPLDHEITLINDEILVNEPYFVLESDLRIHFGSKDIRGYVGVRKVNTSILRKELVGDRNIVFSAGLILSINGLYNSWSNNKP